MCFKEKDTKYKKWIIESFELKETLYYVESQLNFARYVSFSYPYAHSEDDSESLG